MLNVRHRSYKKNANKVFGKDDLANTPMAYWLTMATGSNKKKKSVLLDVVICLIQAQKIGSQQRNFDYCPFCGLRLDS